jgi:hypothetical protein
MSFAPHFGAFRLKVQAFARRRCPPSQVRAPQQPGSIMRSITFVVVFLFFAGAASKQLPLEPLTKFRASGDSEVQAASQWTRALFARPVAQEND